MRAGVFRTGAVATTVQISIPRESGVFPLSVRDTFRLLGIPRESGGVSCESAGTGHKSWYSP